MSLKSRLDRLDKQMRSHDWRCPECPGMLFLHEDDDGTLRDEAGKIITDDDFRCKVCGGPGPEAMSFIIFGNAAPREDGADGPAGQ